MALSRNKKQPAAHAINLGNKVIIGGKKIIIMAGPCAVESEKQINAVAKAVKIAGATVLRGGAFKQRTSPYTFEGLGEKGLKMMFSAAKKNQLLIVTEVLDTRHIEIANKYCDILQIGARNMSNSYLLKAVAKTGKPILLKRGMSATVTEFLMAAEHILANGNPNVILCERGIRTFETETRNTLSIAAVPLIKELSRLPIIVDPSHSTGKSTLVAAMTKAAIAAGADGILIDVHPSPDKALCDGDQAIKPDAFSKLMCELKPLAAAVSRSL